MELQSGAELVASMCDFKVQYTCTPAPKVLTRNPLMGM